MATKSNTKTKTFTVFAKISGDLGVDIQATDFEDAVNQALNLQFTDFVEIKGDANDYDKPYVTSIFINEDN